MSKKRNYSVSTTVHTEVITAMSPTEKIELMNELNFLIQDHEAIVNVCAEKGFKHIFRVLNGKNRDSHNQLNIDQKNINNVISSIMMILIQDVNDLQQSNSDFELKYIKRVLSLHNMYLIRITKELKEMEIAEIDNTPLIKEKNCLATSNIISSTIKTNSSFSSIPLYDDVDNNTVDHSVKHSKKASPKKANTSSFDGRVFFQSAGSQVNAADLIEKSITVSGVKKAQKVNIYVRPDINRVYYVINDDIQGNFNLF